MFKNIFAVVFFFFFLMAGTASATEWGPCPEDATKLCLYQGAAPTAIVVPALAIQQRQPAPAPETSTANTAPATPSTPFNPWPYIVGLGIMAVLGTLYFRRLARIAREDEEARRAAEAVRAEQERRRVRVGLEDNLIAAQMAYDRDQTSNKLADRVTWAKAALHRHDHPDQPLVNDVRANVTVDPSHGYVPGEPFMNNPNAPAVP